MDPERELACKLTGYLAYVRRVMDDPRTSAEIQAWQTVSDIDTSQLRTLLARKWFGTEVLPESKHPGKGHNFAEVRRAAHIVSLASFQEGWQASRKDPFLPRVWRQPGNDFEAVVRLARDTLDYFIGDIQGFQANPRLLAPVMGGESGSLPIPVLHRKVSTAKINPVSGDNTGPKAGENTREAVRSRLTCLFFTDAGLLADIARQIDYYPSFVRQIVLAKNASRHWWQLPNDEDLRADALDLLRKRESRVSMAKNLRVPIPFGVVLWEELDEIERQRGATPAFACYDPYMRAHANRLLGLCCSGGGIRSATFSLGILQALAELRMLRKVDYLSTVSGGGYIGGWLTSWIKRAGSVEMVEDLLSPQQTPNPQSDDHRPIRRLREYSNYLAPQVGALSADTWTIVTIWFRNTAINLGILLPIASAVMLMPFLLQIVQSTVARLYEGLGWRLIFIPAGVLTLVAIGIGLNLSSFDRDGINQQGGPRGNDEPDVLRKVLLPAVATAFLSGGALLGGGMSADPVPLAFWTAVALFVGLLLIQFFGKSWRRSDRTDQTAAVTKEARENTPVILFFSTLAAVSGFFLMRVLLHFREWMETTAAGPWHSVVWWTPLFLTVFSAVAIVNMALMGLRMPDERREWWSRLGAWCTIVCCAWVVFNGLGLYGPWLAWSFGTPANLSLGGVWAVVSGLGARLARSVESGENRSPGLLKRVVIRLAPYVFILGLLWAVSCLNWLALFAWDHPPLTGFFELLHREPYWDTLRYHDSHVLALFLSTLAAGAFLAWRADVNEFSMHHFYRNRLVRCYLGASRRREDRGANAFTGFDNDDDLRLHRLCSRDELTEKNAFDPLPPGYRGPLHVVNAAVNITSGDDLAYQQRKAESFVSTPLYCGYDFMADHSNPSAAAIRQYGFQPTEVFGDGRHSGVTLGTAVAISGAAMNPNMGYQSDPAVAALLTLFNVRLGWWIGNPSDRLRCGKSSPEMGLLYMLSELTGQSNEKRGFINLSDGGHFENLGIYEMVRRRCRYLIVCDGEQDEKMAFSGLANAIRKCRTDFGVEIDLDLCQLRRVVDEPWGKFHCAVGRITYPDQMKRADGPGWIVYLKTSLTHDEPVDVLGYQSAEPLFPHQSTLDQFFDESQFESYRKLGHHVAEKVFQTARDTAEKQSYEINSDEFFEYVNWVWATPSPANESAHLRIAEEYQKLFPSSEKETLSRHFLLPKLAAGASVANVLEQHRFIAFMDLVYKSLDLEHYENHVLHQGWIRMFREWKKNNALNAAWAAEGELYSQSFQAFWRRL